MATIYLAGAIDKDNERNCRWWRGVSETFLLPWGLETINPIKGKELDQNYSAEEIVTEDLRSINNSDAVLAEVGIVTPNYPYIGTSMEIFHAYRSGIPVYCWTYLDDNLFLRYHTKYRSADLFLVFEKLRRRYGDSL